MKHHSEQFVTLSFKHTIGEVVGEVVGDNVGDTDGSTVGDVVGESVQPLHVNRQFCWQ